MPGLQSLAAGPDSRYRAFRRCGVLIGWSRAGRVDARSGLFILLAVAGLVLIAATDSTSPLVPLASALLGMALVTIATSSRDPPAQPRCSCGLRVRSAAADRSGSPRQRDPDAPGHVRARAPGSPDRI